MARTLSLDEFARVFPQYADDALKELNYAVRQETAKVAINEAKARTPVAAADTLSKGSISQTPGEMKRAWRTLRGSRSIRGRTRVVNSKHAAIVNEPYRRLPKGGAVGSRQAPGGVTPLVEVQVKAEQSSIISRSVRRAEEFLARKYRT